MHEYIQMKKYLLPTPYKLTISNASTFLNYDGEHRDQNERNIFHLLQQFSQNKERFFLTSDSASAMALSTLKVCMLDMRGEHQLSPTQHWDYVVLGGVLGDHPPRDRPFELRQHFVSIRHLGSMQLATDTAVLVSKLILHNKLPLKGIPMVDEPTVKGRNKHQEKTTVQMEGFSYVSQRIQIESGVIGEADGKKVYMSEGVRKLLLWEDIEPETLM